MDQKLEKTFDDIAETFKENLKTHKEFYGNFKQIGEIIACYRPQFEHVQADIIKLQDGVKDNKTEIDKRESFIIWTFRGVWIGVSLIIGQWVLQALNVWKFII